jgi:hypothetical protein
LKPFYALALLYPPTRESVLRLALVTLEEMTQTLAWAVENPPERLQVFESPQIKLGGKFMENPQPTPKSVWREPSLQSFAARMVTGVPSGSPWPRNTTTPFRTTPLTSLFTLLAEAAFWLGSGF